MGFAPLNPSYHPNDFGYANISNRCAVWIALHALSAGPRRRVPDRRGGSANKKAGEARLSGFFRARGAVRRAYCFSN